jgi:hypothetical protein
MPAARKRIATQTTGPPRAIPPRPGRAARARRPLSNHGIMTLLPGPPSSTSTPGPPIGTSSPAPPKKVSALALPIRASSPSPLATGDAHGDCGVGDGGRAAKDGDGAAVDEDGAGRVTADGDDVVELVAEDGQRASDGIERGGDGRDDAVGQALEGRRKPALPDGLSPGRLTPGPVADGVPPEDTQRSRSSSSGVSEVVGPPRAAAEGTTRPVGRGLTRRSHPGSRTRRRARFFFPGAPRRNPDPHGAESPSP